MLRSTVQRKLQAYLSETYQGEIAILSGEDDGEPQPPYALVRIGSAENIGEYQMEIWEFSVLVGVFHDADATSSEEAEEAAAEIFELLQDAEIVAAAMEPEVVTSWWEPVTVETSINNTNWQHVAGFRLVAAPEDTEEDDEEDDEEDTEEDEGEG
jgi:hypothetical protein